jgi:hypothetical protein
MFALPLHASGSAKYARAAEDLPSTERSIFRAEALQRYIQNQEKVVLPHLVSPRAFVYLWVLASLIMVAGLILAFWPWMGQFVVRAT